MLRKLWKQMRWSLRTQVIVVLFAGMILLIWAWSNPWQYEGVFDPGNRFRFLGSNSNDGLRWLQSEGRGITVGVRGSAAYLSHIELHGESLTFPNFGEDGSIVACIGLSPSAHRIPRDATYVRFRRRFPEWWWGHLYRPEVWLLPLWLGLIVWTIRKDRAVPK